MYLQIPGAGVQQFPVRWRGDSTTYNKWPPLYIAGFTVPDLVVLFHHYDFAPPHTKVARLASLSGYGSSLLSSRPLLLSTRTAHKRRLRVRSRVAMAANRPLRPPWLLQRPP